MKLTTIISVVLTLSIFTALVLCQGTNLNFNRCLNVSITPPPGSQIASSPAQQTFTFEFNQAVTISFDGGYAELDSSKDDAFFRINYMNPTRKVNSVLYYEACIFLKSLGTLYRPISMTRYGTRTKFSLQFAALLANTDYRLHIGPCLLVDYIYESSYMQFSYSTGHTVPAESGGDWGMNFCDDISILRPLPPLSSAVVTGMNSITSVACTVSGGVSKVILSLKYLSSSVGYYSLQNFSSNGESYALKTPMMIHSSKFNKTKASFPLKFIQYAHPVIEQVKSRLAYDPYSGSRSGFPISREHAQTFFNEYITDSSISLTVDDTDYQSLPGEDPRKSLDTKTLEQRIVQMYMAIFTYSNGRRAVIFLNPTSQGYAHPFWKLQHQNDNGIVCPAGSTRNGLNSDYEAYHSMEVDNQVTHEVHKIGLPNVNHNLVLTVQTASATSVVTISSSNKESAGNVTVEYRDQDIYQEGLLQKAISFDIRFLFNGELVPLTDIRSISFIPIQHANNMNTNDTIFMLPTRFKETASCDDKYGTGLEHSLAFYLQKMENSVTSLNAYASRLQSSDSIQVIDDQLVLTYDNNNYNDVIVTIDASALDFEEAKLGNISYEQKPNRGDFSERLAEYIISCTNIGESNSTFQVSLSCNPGIAIQGPDTYYSHLEPQETISFAFNLESTTDISGDIICTSNITVHKLLLWSNVNKTSIFSDSIYLDGGYFTPKCEAAFYQPYLQFPKTTFDSNPNILEEVDNPFSITLLGDWSMDSQGRLSRSGSAFIRNGAIEPITANILAAITCANFDILYQSWNQTSLQSEEMAVLNFTLRTRQEDTQAMVDDQVSTTYMCYLNVTIMKDYECWSNIGQSHVQNFTVAISFSCPVGHVGLLCIPTCYGYNSSDTQVCSGHGQCDSPDNCTCDPGYIGDDCAWVRCYDRNSSDLNVCSGHGRCHTPDNCTCHNGWTGIDCSTPICFTFEGSDLTVCNGHGSCTGNDTCECEEGHTGEDCSIPICYNIQANTSSVCSGHGVCGSPDNCTCFTGYSGMECDAWECYNISNSDPQVCGSHGNCILPDHCACEFGYGSHDCSQYLCDGTLSRNSSVCSFHGNCTQPEQCDCEPGYSGTYCELSICFGKNQSDPVVCSGHGNCESPDVCDCHVGYTGFDCSVPQCFSINGSDPIVCSGHGECSSHDICRCEADYFGLDCSVPMCHGVLANESIVCSGNGICLHSNNCSCQVGYHGNSCEDWTCYGLNKEDSAVCTGHGDCSALDTCRCHAGYVDAECDLSVCYGKNSSDPEVCNGRGGCNSPDNCTCTLGYIGSECSEHLCYSLSQFDSMVCSGHGHCDSPDNCICDSGYTGARCDISICYGYNSSDPMVCSSQGRCLTPNNCTCNFGYAGNNCESFGCSNRLPDDPLVCSGRGVCTSAENCFCSEGYSGSNCEFTTCFGVNSSRPLDTCSGHGTCLDIDNCDCDPGYSGMDCSTVACGGVNSTNDEVCSGKGMCSGPNLCICDEGYTGSECQLPLCHGLNSSDTHVCSSQGLCVAPDECDCNNSGYTGSMCELPLCFGKNSSDTSVCSGEGVCGSPNNCTCVYGRSGLECEQFVCFDKNSSDPTVCSGRGSCVGIDTCLCNFGFNGSICQHSNFTHSLFCFGFEASDSEVCSSRGSCIKNDTCLCSAGYIGSRCEYIICFGENTYDTSSVCSNHGECISPNNCSCYDGYDGPECESIMCSGKSLSDPSVCNGRGSCIDANLCSCSSRYTGIDCEIPKCGGIPANNQKVCNGVGNCTEYNQCSCRPGYSGILCEVPICFSKNATDPTVCSSNGKCKAPDTCICDNDYTGSSCETLKDESNKCQASFSLYVNNIKVKTNNETNVDASSLHWSWRNGYSVTVLSISLLNNANRSIKYELHTVCSAKGFSFSPNISTSEVVLSPKERYSQDDLIVSFESTVIQDRLQQLTCTVSITPSPTPLSICSSYDSLNSPNLIETTFNVIRIDTCPLISRDQVAAMSPYPARAELESDHCPGCTDISYGIWNIILDKNNSSLVNQTATVTNTVRVAVKNNEAHKVKYAGYLTCFYHEQVILASIQESSVIDNGKSHIFEYNLTLANVPCIVDNGAPKNGRLGPKKRTTTITCEPTGIICKFRVSVQPIFCWTDRSIAGYARDLTFAEIKYQSDYLRSVSRREIAIAAVSCIIMIFGSAIMISLWKHPRDNSFLFLNLLHYMFPSSAPEQPPAPISAAQMKQQEKQKQRQDASLGIICEACKKKPARYLVTVFGFSDEDCQFDVCENNKCFNDLNDEHNAHNLKLICSIFDYLNQEYLTTSNKASFVRQRTSTRMNTPDKNRIGPQRVTSSPRKLFYKRLSSQSKDFLSSTNFMDQDPTTHYDQMVSETNYTTCPSPGNVVNMAQMIEDEEQEEEARWRSTSLQRRKKHNIDLQQSSVRQNRLNNLFWESNISLFGSVHNNNNNNNSEIREPSTSTLMNPPQPNIVVHPNELLANGSIQVTEHLRDGTQKSSIPQSEFIDNYDDLIITDYDENEEGLQSIM